MIRAHVTVGVSVCDVLFAGDSISGANDAGGRDGDNHVVHQRRGLAARAGDVTVKPSANTWTEFQVTDVDGRVQIAANKGDLTVQDDKGTTTMAQGQQTTRDDTSDMEKKKKHRCGTGAATAAGGGIMSSTPVVYGLAAVGGVAIWIWTRSEGPVSPSCPTSSCP